MTRRVRPLAAALIGGLALLLLPQRADLAARPSAQPTPSDQAQPAASAVVTAQVVDATTRRPVGGAIVTLSLGAPAASGRPPIPAAQARRGVGVAGADGRVVFLDVPAGTYSLAATLNGYTPGASGRRRPGGPGHPFTIEDGARLVDVAIPIWRLAAISGTVRDDRGEPAVGISVWAMRRTTTGGRLELTFTGGSVEATDERGRYRLSNLMPGAYVVVVRSATQSAAVSTVDAYHAAVTSGASASIVREWSQTGALRLSTAGLVIDDWQVSVSIGAPQPLPGPDGTLLVHPTVYHPQTRSPAEAAVITLEAGDERLGVDLTLPLVTGARVSGTLRDPDGPAANHGIRLFPDGTDGPSVDVPVAYGTTDAAGRFALLGVPPGTYRLRAHRVPPVGPTITRPVPPAAGGLPVAVAEVVAPPVDPAGPSLFAEVPVSIGESHVDGLSVALQPGARVSGRVAFEGDTPPPGTADLQRMSLSVRPIAGSVPGGDARVDAQGHFTTAGHPPGRYTLVSTSAPGPRWTLASIRVAGIDVAEQAFTIGATDIDDVVVTFTDRVTSLAGTVRAADGGPDSEATIVVFPAGVQDWISAGMPAGRVATATASATGAYEVRIPLPGDYLVVALPPEIVPDIDPDFVTRFAQQAVRVSFAAGETKTQPLTVARVR